MFVENAFLSILNIKTDIIGRAMLKDEITYPVAVEVNLELIIMKGVKG